MRQLPIDEVMEQIRSGLSAGTAAVIIAEPGAGKSTRVPLALLDEPWLSGMKMMMLEPRRLAARSVAAYMSAQLGEPVGQTVGYRVKQETKISNRTRIEVVTEGVLTRMLQDDPTLDGIGLVLFDEFHERSLHADLGLALTLQSRLMLRPELRIAVMSATMEAEPVAALLGDAAIIRSSGRAYPVETRYVGKPDPGKLADKLTSVIELALAEHEGDALVFLPGVGEITRTAERLAHSVPRSVKVLQLHGGLRLQEQEEAIQPTDGSVRKVVLSTNVAETSLTVEGVRIVIDSGLRRTSTFSPRTGMSRLETTTISKSSADQRRGRAGRVAPGVCYRLWSESEHALLPNADAPEIAESDLAALALELARWGAADPRELDWLTEPPAAAFSQARQLLRELGALDDAGRLTEHGKSMSDLGTHPRLAHMILSAIPLGAGRLACDLAALLEERDPLRAVIGDANTDIRLRIDAVRQGSGDPGVIRRIRTESERRYRQSGIPDAGESSDSDRETGILLALAYPDRIGRSRGNGRYVLTNGRGAAFRVAQPLSKEEFVVVAELDDSGADGRIELSAPVRQVDLEKHLASAIVREERVDWDAGSGTVAARRIERIGAVVLRERVIQNPSPDLVLAALLTGIRLEGLSVLPWNKAATQLLNRLRFMHRVFPDYPDVSDEALLHTLDHWLAPFAAGIRNRNEFSRLPLTDALKSLLDWEQLQKLEAAAPTHYVVPSGSRIPIDYSDSDKPVLAVRLQEMFGHSHTPVIANGSVPLTVHLLSPAQRPVQVTQDLESFWRNTYFEVRKDLRGRYPKHYWPENPMEAQATNRVRPRT